MPFDRSTARSLAGLAVIAAIAVSRHRPSGRPR